LGAVVVKRRIDRRIWMYWEGPLPDYIALCIESICARNRSADIVLLDRAGFDTMFTTDCDIDLDRLDPVKRSDFVRAYVLRRFGGLYLDVDCVVLRSLEPVFEAAERTGFTVVHQPDAEPQTNFMASVAGGAVIEALYAGICATLRERRPLAWLDLATAPLLPALAAHAGTVTTLPAEWIAPIHWSEPERFLTRAPDEVHERSLAPAALSYMLSNDTIGSREGTRHLKTLPREELLREDYFLSFLFRRAFARSPATA
jgi:mannosyltransferase OCH1-like enzyme